MAFWVNRSLLRGKPNILREGLLCRELPNNIFSVSDCAYFDKCYAKRSLSQPLFDDKPLRVTDKLQSIRVPASIEGHTSASTYPFYRDGLTQLISPNGFQIGGCKSSRTTPSYRRGSLFSTHPYGSRKGGYRDLVEMPPQQACGLTSAHTSCLPLIKTQTNNRSCILKLPVDEVCDRMLMCVPIASFLSSIFRENGHSQNLKPHRFLQSPQWASRFLVLAY